MPVYGAAVQEANTQPCPVVLDVEYAGQAKTPWGTLSAGFNAQTKINRND